MSEGLVRERPGGGGPPDQDAPSSQEEPPAEVGAGGASPAKLVGGLAGMVLVVWGLANLFLAFAYYPQWFDLGSGNEFLQKGIIAVLAVVAGVGGVSVLFFFLNMFVEGLPERASGGVMPYVYLLPGVGLIALVLIYPTIQTIHYSFANADSTEYVGLENYREIFSDSVFWQSIVNNVLWLALVPAVVVAIGVVVAVLADKLSTQGEKIAKSAIFVPMAISFVGASAIWGLVYAFDAGDIQTGLLNAVWSSVGGEPQAWLQIDTARLNSLLMMVILVWLQVGFAMILLSSAIKGVPEETLEAASIDGASPWQTFWRVVIPQIKGTIITVFITVTILVLKVFDIVYVLTNGRDKSNVIANLFFNELFANQQAGQAAAIVVVLLVAVMPILYYQVRHFRQEEASR